MQARSNITLSISEARAHSEELVSSIKPLIIPILDESLATPLQRLGSDEKLFVFDIDNTLYKQAYGMHENIVELITEFAQTIIPDEKKAAEKVSEYYCTYGVTIKGFIAEYNEQTDLSTWEEMYDNRLRIEEFVKPDYTLREILLELARNRVRIIALTNSSANVGIRMLRGLDILDCFESVLHCAYRKNCEFFCKPQQQVYSFVENLYKVKNNNNIFIFEDRELNLIEPQKRGWNTILIDEENHIKKKLSELATELF